MKLYGGGSPNAQKVVLMLEELGIAYDLIPVDVYGGEQFSPEFLALNPIGKYPVLIDEDGAAAGQPIFESCAILIYLAETYGPEFLPLSGAARWETLEWLIAQAAWIGPMLGQHTYFRIQPSEAGTHAAIRYRDQAERVFQVLNQHLSSREWLASERYTIADIATYPWVASLTGLGFDWSDYPSLNSWFQRLSARPAATRVAEFRDKILSAIPAELPEAGTNRLYQRQDGPKIDYGVLFAPSLDNDQTT
ncbi:MAG: glutathione S-transferase family protein [Sphingobium sp.]